MSPHLTALRSILLDAADEDEPTTEACSLARLRAGGWTADHRALADAVVAIADLRRLEAGLLDPRMVTRGMTAPLVDRHQEAARLLTGRLDEACDVLARRPEVAA